MPKFSKGHSFGNTVYKVAFPIAIFIREKFYYGEKIGYSPGENSTTEKLQYFSRGAGVGGGGEILIADNHCLFFGGNSEKWVTH